MYDFDKCIKTAKQASFQFYKSKKQYIPELDHREVIAEANLAMIEAAETWDMERGCPIESWTAKMVHQTLKKKFSRDDAIIDIEDIETLSNEDLSPKHQNPERLVIEKEKHVERRKYLSQTSRKILKIINECEYIPEKKNEAKRIIKTELRERGVTWRKISASFKELREVTAQI